MNCDQKIKMASPIWTVGHSTRDIGTFISLLEENGIKLVADVRMFPGSKRYPQFNRDALAESLKEHRIRYEHFPELGGRRKPKKDSPNTTWRNEGFRGYADYMETEEFREGITRLVNLAEEKQPSSSPSPNREKESPLFLSRWERRTQSASEGKEEAWGEDRGEGIRIAIMCAEALWWRCHRALISDFLKARGLEVTHIVNLARTESHPFTSAARIVNGKLSYRPRTQR